MATPRESFVYLLRDPRAEDQRASAFYVGKGTKNRPLDHLAEAREYLRRNIERAMAVINDADRTMQVRPGYTPEQEESDALDEAEAVQIDAHAKLDLINEIEAAGEQVIIDTIHREDGYLTETEALIAEAALIAALGMKTYGNEVQGHRLRMTPESVFTQAANAVEVDVNDLAVAHHGIIVPLSPNDVDKVRYGGHLLAADQDHLWERSRRYWGNTALPKQAMIERAAQDPDDVSPTLLAITRNPLGCRGNIVIGVWQLSKIGPASDGDGRWEYWGPGREAEDPATTELREQLRGNTIVMNGKLVTHREDRTYFGGRY